MKDSKSADQKTIDCVKASPAARVNVAVTDVDGVLRGKYIHKDKFLSALDGDFGFCNTVFGWNMAVLFKTSAAAFVDWLTALELEVGIPAKLGAVKVSKQHLLRLLGVAVADICQQTNPRRCTRADFERIFTEAL